MLKKIVSYAALCAFVVATAGCATNSKNIQSSYVSPLQYEEYSCKQLSGEAQRIQARVQELGGQLDSNSTKDKVAVGVAAVLFWPALFFMKGKDGAKEAEFARLKGEYEAVQKAAIKKCG